jgi:hypothetical protein
MPEDRVTLWQAGNPPPCIARPFVPSALVAFPGGHGLFDGTATPRPSRRHLKFKTTIAI